VYPFNNCSEDEEETFNRIFASSDSESDFENFVAQNKQQKRRLSEPTGEELPTPAKEKPSKPKRGRQKRKKEAASIEDGERTPVIITEEATKLKTEELHVDKENRIEEKMIVEEIKVVPKPPPPRRAQFKKRPIKGEEEILSSFLEKGLDKEDVLMMKLAFVRLRGVRDEMVEGMHWAYYPHNILSKEREKREGRRGRGRDREREGGRERA
jgi:hypothetical protein